jgi:hypothetical protein
MTALARRNEDNHENLRIPGIRTENRAHEFQSTRALLSTILWQFSVNVQEFEFIYIFVVDLMALFQ